MTSLLHVTTTDISLALLLTPQLRAFRDAGYEVLLASAPGPYVDVLAAEGFRHLPLRHATRSMAPHRDVAALAELGQLFRSVRPAIVHTHNPKPGVYGRLAARAVGVPLVVNTQHGLYAQPGDPVGRRVAVYSLERLAAAGSDIELVQNPEDIEVLARLGVSRRKLWLLGNGIDLARFKPPSGAARAAARRALGIRPEAVVVGTVGRLVWEKGYGELFAAARTLLSRPTALDVIVVGPTDLAKGDPLTPGDVATAEAGGVRFLGHRDDVERIYHALDVFVLASHREGFPRAAMEAAASGLPVVATDIRGCRQVVEHGRTGLLVPARDADSLLDAITRLVADPDLRFAMGTAAAAKAGAEFDQRRVIETTLDAYQRLGRS